jgi:hypothetical protein
VFSGARNVFKTKWFLIKRTEDDLLRVWIDAHVVAGLKNFLSRLSKIERSFGTFPNHRRYENMFLNNFLISIFKVRLYFNQDMSCPEIGKMI